MKRSILLVAAIATSVFFLNCGMPMSGNDAGTGGGTGGGATGGGTGGGTTGGGTTGGGTTGGGTTGGGTTGGGSGGCTPSDWSQAVDLQGDFNPAANGNPPYNSAVKGMPSATSGKFDFLIFELWYFGGSMNPTFPYTLPLTAANYQSCEGCVLIQEACDNMAGNCARLYFATSGSVTYTTATKVAAAGQFVGSATTLHFQEWNLSGMNDMAVSNGRCLDVASVAFNGRWPQAAPTDGGTDAGMMGTDAGTDAGMTTTDAGNPDAGDGG